MDSPQILTLVISGVTFVQHAIVLAIHPYTAQPGGLRSHHIGRRSRDVKELIGRQAERPKRQRIHARMGLVIAGVL